MGVMPKAKPFVHLHNHSDYSLLDGATSIARMAHLAAETGMPAAALTDHGNMFGAVEFHKKMREAGVQPILGCEVYVAKGSRHEKQMRPGEKPYHHLTLLVRDGEGYRNLIQLVTAGYLEGFYHKPRVDKELIKEHAGGLIALSGCLSGEVPQAAMRNDMEGLVRAASEWREVFGAENFYLEVQDHGIAEQPRVNGMLRDASRKHGFPLVVTNDCHFPRPDDHEAHQTLLCIQTARTMEQGPPLGHTAEHSFKSPAEMWARFGAEWAGALENTLAIAGRCAFELPTGRMLLPDFQIPGGEHASDYFRRMAHEGLERRLRGPVAAAEKAGAPPIAREAYHARLEQELDLIVKMNFTGYFLIVADFIQYARGKGIPVGPGRGSVGGSLAAYALGITDIDPMRYGLIFERFLNPERISPPDIDIDFCERRRGEVIQYVTEKYGRDSVAQIITFGTMKARAVIRDVGRALGMSYGETDRIAKMIPFELGMTLERARKAVPDLDREAKENPAVARLLELSSRLEGLVRHASIHAAGVVIAPGRVSDYVPLYKTDKDEIVTQYAKDAVEQVGLMKMDFLGLRTLTLLDDALRSLRETDGITLDLDAVSLTDPEVYALFSRGDTYAVFQFESGGMRDILRRLKPDRIEDLIALNALYRPGPIQGGVIDDYIKRRHGKEQTRYLVPQLQPILEETYGVIVYQEQVMRIAQEVAGFSLGGGDLLRRAMGKKKAGEMHKLEADFIEGAVKRGVPMAKARELYDLVEKFAGYGFNKSHSAAYALVAYRTAWMKAHFPLHFMAAVLNSFKGDTRNIVEALQECRAMGMEVQPPDVNRSEMDFAVRDGKIVYGLSSIRNVGEKALESLLQARRDMGGKITSFFDLVGKSDSRLCNQKVWDSLIKAGALDSLGYKRAQMAAVLEQALSQAQASSRNGLKGVGLLFEDDPVMTDERLMPPIDEWPDDQRLAAEREVLGFYIQGSPLDRFREDIEHFATATTRTLPNQPDRSEQALAGIVHKVRQKTTRRGAVMAIVTLEDNYGSIEALFFPENYERCKDVLKEEALLLCKGAVDVVSEGKEAKLLAESAVPLEKLRERRGRSVLIETNAIGFEDAMLDELQGLLRKHRGDKPVHLRLRYPRRFAVLLALSPACRVAPSEAFFREVSALLGEHSVKLEI